MSIPPEPASAALTRLHICPLPCYPPAMGYLLRFFVLLTRIATALFKPNREGHLQASERGLHWVKAAEGSTPNAATSTATVPEPPAGLDFSKLEHASPEERKAAIEFLAQVAVDRVEGVAAHLEGGKAAAEPTRHSNS
jgi:hypothetical protein